VADSNAPAEDVLVIDDRRVMAFPAVYARTLGEGLRLIEERPWRQVWLDHDLGGDETIMPIVELLEQRALDGRPLPIGTICVHSANPPGAMTISAALERWYRLRRVDAAWFTRRPGGPQRASLRP
jgi:hypothetical protein